MCRICIAQEPMEVADLMFRFDNRKVSISGEQKRRHMSLNTAAVSH